MWINWYIWNLEFSFHIIFFFAITKFKVHNFMIKLVLYIFKKTQALQKFLLKLVSHIKMKKKTYFTAQKKKKISSIFGPFVLNAGIHAKVS